MFKTLEKITEQIFFEEKDDLDFDASLWTYSIAPHKYVFFSKKEGICKEKPSSSWIYLNKANRWLSREEGVSNVVINVFEKTYSLPKSLEVIAEAINESTWICDLDEDWDHEGASRINKEIYISAIEFLINYSLEVLKKSSLIVDTPEINPCKNGSIDLSWRTHYARMLVNIRKVENEILAYYYGDFYNNKSPIKGYVSIENISEHLAIWMKSLV